MPWPIKSQTPSKEWLRLQRNHLRIKIPHLLLRVKEMRRTSQRMLLVATPNLSLPLLTPMPSPRRLLLLMPMLKPLLRLNKTLLMLLRPKMLLRRSQITRKLNNWSQRVPIQLHQLVPHQKLRRSITRRSHPPACTKEAMLPQLKLEISLIIQLLLTTKCQTSERTETFSLLESTLRTLRRSWSTSGTHRRKESLPHRTILCQTSALIEISSMLDPASKPPRRNSRPNGTQSRTRMACGLSHSQLTTVPTPIPAELCKINSNYYLSKSK